MPPKKEDSPNGKDLLKMFKTEIKKGFRDPC